ncbi:hypothetical protein ACPUER_35095 [Burkholderia sp. DN3021]|uniref:hypothetical protein n=1 Tax=Burkholderia sp. DN3021 TaxID=3410137 RepID=UPI003C7DCA78
MTAEATQPEILFFLDHNVVLLVKNANKGRERLDKKPAALEKLRAIDLLQHAIGLLLPLWNGESRREGESRCTGRCRQARSASMP